MKFLGKPALWKSILLSCAFSLIGVGLFVLINYFGNVAALALIILVFGAKLGYDFGGGKKKYMFFVVIPVSLIFSFVSLYLGLFVNYLHQGLSVTFFNVFGYISSLANPWKFISGDIYYFLGFLAIALGLLIWQRQYENNMQKKQAENEQKIEELKIDKNNK